MHISPSAPCLLDPNHISFTDGTTFFFEHIVVELAESYEPFLWSFCDLSIWSLRRSILVIKCTIWRTDMVQKAAEAHLFIVVVDEVMRGLCEPELRLLNQMVVTATTVAMIMTTIMTMTTITNQVNGVSRILSKRWGYNLLSRGSWMLRCYRQS